MKNKTPLSYLNQAASVSESERFQIWSIFAQSDSDSESKKAIFAPALLSYLNTYIDLAIGTGKNPPSENSSKTTPKQRTAQIGAKNHGGKP